MHPDAHEIRRTTKSRLNRLLGGMAFFIAAMALGWLLATHPVVNPSLTPPVAEATPLAWPASELRPLPEIVREVAPGVVSVGAVRRTLVMERSVDFFDFFFARPREALQRTPYLGSGFLVDDEGHILTNYHVVQNAESIFVTLHDGREYEARLLDADRFIDIALLRIQADASDLPAPLKLGDSDMLEIGEPAVAVGNPFGNLIDDHRPTVTTGVISALHRSFRPDRENLRVYQDMIQTDAAINPGNSGGPLLNAHGRVVGLNTFIVSGTGANIGLGFAIPINRARAFYEEVRTHGRLRPLAIDFNVMTIETARIQGVLVSHMEDSGPAAEAGLQLGDVITHVDSRRIRTREELLLNLAGHQFGDQVSFRVWRQGESVEIAYRMTLAVDDSAPVPMRRPRRL